MLSRRKRRPKGALFSGLGITPEPFETLVPSHLYRYRKNRAICRHPRGRIGPLRLPQPRQEFAAIPDQ